MKCFSLKPFGGCHLLSAKASMTTAGKIAEKGEADEVSCRGLRGKSEAIRLAYCNGTEHSAFSQAELGRVTKTKTNHLYWSEFIVNLFVIFKGVVREKSLVKPTGWCPRLRGFLGCGTPVSRIEALLNKLGQLVTLVCDYPQDL